MPVTLQTASAQPIVALLGLALLGLTLLGREDRGDLEVYGIPSPVSHRLNGEW